MRTWATLGLDLALLTVATVLALLLRENLYFDPTKVADLMPYLASSLVVALPVMPMFGLNRQLWRYSVMPDYSRVLIAIACIVLGACLITFTINRMEGVARSIPILQALLAVCILVGARIAVRSWYASRPVPMSDLSTSCHRPCCQAPKRRLDRRLVDFNQPLPEVCCRVRPGSNSHCGHRPSCWASCGPPCSSTSCLRGARTLARRATPACGSRGLYRPNPGDAGVRPSSPKTTGGTPPH